MTEQQLPSRRMFLKSSSAAATGLALASGLSFSRSAHAAEGDSDKLKVALIGCGGRGNGAAGNCLQGSQNMEIWAVADAFEDKAKKTGQRFNIPEDRIYSGFDAYKKAIASGCDMVILATPPGFRPPHYKAAIEAGKHVFMEKPCCVDGPGFLTLQEANKLADEKGLKVGVGLQRRHDARYKAGIAQIHDGKYGNLICSRVYWNGGGVWVRPRAKDENEMQYQMKNWYYFVWLCGDNICEQHVHNLDIANWAKGAHPVKANAMGGREVRKGKDHGQIFDHHFVEFTYPDETKMYSQCRHIRGCWGSVSEYFHGDKGQGGPHGEGRGPNAYVQEHTALVNAIRNGLDHNEGWYGATSSMTAVLGRDASYSGREISWDDAVNKGDPWFPIEEPLAWTDNPPVVPNEDGKYPIPVPGKWRPF